MKIKDLKTVDINTKERFSKNGGCFGSKKSLVSSLWHLKMPFEFFAKIDTLSYEDTEETILNVLNDLK